MNMHLCPICKGNETEIKLKPVSDHITKGEFEIRSCRNCGISYTFPQPDNLDPYYPLKYRGYNAFVRNILRFFFKVRVNNWARKFGVPGDVLEIGCGPGFMLDAFRKKGWRVLGTERKEKMAINAKDALGLDVHIGDIGALPEQREFDLIVMFNVLEHLKDPLQVINECSRRLKKDGTLIISVPNLESWQAKYAGSVWFHLDPPRHLYHFTARSLDNLLSKSGLKINNIQYVSFEHDPFGWSESIINKITGNYNVFTRYLMGIEPLGKKVLLYIMLSLLLAFPALILSSISWLRKKGALMQVSAAFAET